MASVNPSSRRWSFGWRGLLTDITLLIAGAGILCGLYLAVRYLWRVL